MSDAADAAPRDTGWSADLASGAAMAGLLLPEAVAYAGIAGLPPATGVMGLVAGLSAYALLGASRFALVAATSSSAAVLGASTATLANGDTALQQALAAGLVLITGLAFLLAAAARLGSLSNFISRPVLRGFAFGLALTIVLRQLQHMTGVAAASHETLLAALQWLAQWRGWSPAGVALGAPALALLLGARHVEALRRWPVTLIVLALGTVAADAMKVPDVERVGPVLLSLALPTLPALEQTQWLRVGELALALVLLLFAESEGAIRSATLTARDTPGNANRDLAALGAANLLSGLFRGLPVGAGFSATMANQAAGARSRRSGIVALAVVLLLLALLLPWVERVPVPILAAVVVAALSHALSLAAFAPYFRWRRDRAAALAAAVAVILLGVLDGLLVGIVFSLAMTLRDLTLPRVSELGRLGPQGHDFLPLDRHVQAERVLGVLLLRPEVPLFFANAEGVLAEVRRRILAASPHAVVLSLEESPDLDGTALEALCTLAAECAAQGRPIVLARLKERALEVLRRVAAPGLGNAALEVGSVDDAVRRVASTASTRTP